MVFRGGQPPRLDLLPQRAAGREQLPVRIVLAGDRAAPRRVGPDKARGVVLPGPHLARHPLDIRVVQPLVVDMPPLGPVPERLAKRPADRQLPLDGPGRIRLHDQRVAGAREKVSGLGLTPLISSPFDLLWLWTHSGTAKPNEAVLFAGSISAASFFTLDLTLRYVIQSTGNFEITASKAASYRLRNSPLISWSL